MNAADATQAWVKQEAANAKGGVMRTIAILLSTIPEALPMGVIVLAVLFLDAPLAAFGGGLVLNQLVGAAVRRVGSPPNSYSYAQCSPWTTPATLHVLSASAAKTKAGPSSLRSLPPGVWISPSVHIMSFAVAYILTAATLLGPSFNNSVATYASSTVPAAAIACLATLAGFVLFRVFTRCDSAASIGASVVAGAVLGVCWAFLIGAINIDALNIMHIPRLPVTEPAAATYICNDAAE